MNREPGSFTTFSFFYFRIRNFNALFEKAQRGHFLKIEQGTPIVLEVNGLVDYSDP